MPVTVNAPGMWDSILQDVINRSERTPQADGSYTFDSTGEPTKNLVGRPGKESAYYPPPTDRGRRMDPRKYYDRVIGNMEGEIADGEVPLNQKRGNPNDYDPMMIEMLKRWIGRQ